MAYGDSAERQISDRESVGSIFRRDFMHVNPHGRFDGN
jgi:hypothetical protein